MSDVLEIVARYVGKTSATYRYIAADLAALSRPEAKVTEEMVDRAVAGIDSVRQWNPSVKGDYARRIARAALEAALCTNNQEIAR